MSTLHSSLLGPVPGCAGSMASCVHLKASKKVMLVCTLMIHAWPGLALQPHDASVCPSQLCCSTSCFSGS